MLKNPLFRLLGLTFFILTTLSLLPAFHSAAYSPIMIVIAQEPTYEEINEVSQKLNCPTCQGINLADCRTLTCQQWKERVGDLIQEGYSEQEILDDFAAQYGRQVLQEPPRSGFTLILWVLPFIILLAGGGWLFYTMRGWTAQSAVAASPAESSSEAIVHPPKSLDSYLSDVDRDLGLD
ncbi:MAG: cytochrome c-type biogenesis protein [Chloroflexota bacterium]